MTTVELAALLKAPKLPHYLERIDQLLIESVESAGPALKQHLHKVVQARGKRLRPAMMIASAASQGADVTDTILRAGAALELVHLSSLVHDDAIDKAAIRWGKPTIYSEAGVSHALVAGDYLLALSARVAAGTYSVAEVIASAAMAMCDGQLMEMSDEFNADRTMDSYLAAVRMKTGALFSAAAQVGAMCAEAPPAKVTAFARFGELFGVSYQLADDLLDIMSTPGAMGKPVGNDIKNGVYTLPVLLALKTPAAKKLRGLLGKNKGSADLSKIVEALKAEHVFEQSTREIQRYAGEAASALGPARQNQALLALSEFPATYLGGLLEEKSKKVVNK